jgi:ribosomal protein S27E
MQMMKTIATMHLMMGLCYVIIRRVVMLEIHCRDCDGDSLTFEECGTITCYEQGEDEPEGGSAVILTKKTALHLAEELTKWAGRQV